VRLQLDRELERKKREGISWETEGRRIGNGRWRHNNRNYNNNNNGFFVERGRGILTDFGDIMRALELEDQLQERRLKMVVLSENRVERERNLEREYDIRLNEMKRKREGEERKFKLELEQVGFFFLCCY